MTIAVVLILAMLWIAVLAPPILRARDRQDRADSVGSFSHQLGLLGRANGTDRDGPPAKRRLTPLMGPIVGTPRAMTDAQRRRRDVLLALFAVAVLTFCAAIALRSTVAFALHIVADVGLIAYVYLLVQHKQRAQGSRPLLARGGVAPIALFAEHERRYEPAVVPRLVPIRQTASR